MKKLFFVLALYLSSSVLSAPLPKVFLFVIDGVRDLEMRGRAKDDGGQTVSPESLFPFLTQVKKKGAFFPEMRISNPSGVSFPGYSDIFTGKRQTAILNNDASPEKISGPTLFEAFKAKNGTTKNDILFVTSWGKLCEIAGRSLEADAFTKTCGFEKGKSMKGQTFEYARTDSDTFIEASRLIKENHPRLTFIQFNDADEEAHFHKDVKKKRDVEYGIHNYHQALRNSDYYIGRLWKQIENDPFYKDSTYFFVTTDHGRDDSKDIMDFSDHGHCFFCSGYKNIFGIAAGPGVQTGNFEKEYSHLDIAPTIAKILDTEFPSATGNPIKEVVPVRSLSNTN